MLKYNCRKTVPGDVSGCTDQPSISMNINKFSKCPEEHTVLPPQPFCRPVLLLLRHFLSSFRRLLFPYFFSMASSFPSLLLLSTINSPTWSIPQQSKANTAGCHAIILCTIKSCNRQTTALANTVVQFLHS